MAKAPWLIEKEKMSMRVLVRGYVQKGIHRLNWRGPPGEEEIVAVSVRDTGISSAFKSLKGTES